MTQEILNLSFPPNSTLNWKNGVLHGKCEWNTISSKLLAGGNYKNGYEIGLHIFNAGREKEFHFYF